LNDYGFPDFEESLEIYHFVNPDSLAAGKWTPQVSDREETEKESPTFYLIFQNEGPFLSSILYKIDDSHGQDRLRQEITALCNKAIVAEAIDLSNIIGMERIIKKVYHTLNLGLQYLSKEEEAKALEILRFVPIQRLFQCGVSTTIVLKRKAESILKGPWFSGDRENLVFLDPPHFEKFEGILKKRPALYRDGIYEDFKDIKDLREIESFLESIDTVVNFFGKELNVYPPKLKEMDLSGCYPERWEEITLSKIFLTSFANQVLKGVLQFETIVQAQVKDFLFRVFERDVQGKGVIKMEVRDGLKEWFHSIENDPNKEQFLFAFNDFCLDLFEEEFGKIPPEEEVDPRFVKGLLVRK